MQTLITDADYEKTISLLKSEYNSISEDGCVFALFQTEYDFEGNAVHDFFDVIFAATAIGYEYVNTIVYPTDTPQTASFSDNSKYIVWLCKCHSKMKFIKDAIREKHIWKDVEWGKRAKNYNPKGKDPGNVWIPTEDDGKANITNHILLGNDGVIKRLLAMSACEGDFRIVTGPKKSSAVQISPAAPQGKKAPLESKIIFKTSEDMADISDGTVKLFVTSPPYWNLKDYFKAGQIGQESYEIYLARMKKVWSECYKKLSPDGSLWVNINIRVQKGKVVLIPRDFVNMCREIGFFYKGIVIWHKSSGIPTSDKNIVDRHEYVLIFSKSKYLTLNSSVFSSFADYKNSKINGGAFWNINRKAGSVGKHYVHPAIFPNELAARIIKSTTCEGETVADPFLGSGTTLIAAHKAGRSCFGYEYNEGFLPLIKSRLDAEIPDADVSLILP